MKLERNGVAEGFDPAILKRSGGPSISARQTCLSQFHLQQSLFYDRVSQTLYLNNAKAGCSSVKAALLRTFSLRDGFSLPEPLPLEVIHGAHRCWSREYSSIEPGKTFVFSMVRNPFTRILSSYLDKIVRPGILRSQFCIRHGKDPESEITFRDFLEMIDPSVELFDQHWRPQTANLYVGAIQIDRVYHLENQEPLWTDLAVRLGPGFWRQIVDAHHTGAASLLRQHLDPWCVKRIQALYQSDFETFNYSPDPSNIDVAPATGLSLPANGGELYRCLEILEAKLEGRQPVSGSTVGPSEAAMLGKMTDDLAAMADGTPAERYMALATRAGMSARRAAERISDLRELLSIAPYAVGHAFLLSDLLINEGRQAEARRLLSDLRNSTWQTDLVDRRLRRMEGP